jgi:DNA-binding ferritin-like protein
MRNKISIINNNLKKKNNSLINNLLLLKNQMQIYHWQTNSFSRHKAADELIDQSTSIIDKIVESYQGRYNKLLLNNETNSIILENLNDEQIIEFLNIMRDFFEKDFKNYVNATNSNLFNLRDELLQNINKTLYLFTLE